ncbi:MAG: TolC family protein [Fodinibius sp.]|nr:TolC family protein [Fodinibius sp.]
MKNNTITLSLLLLLISTTIAAAQPGSMQPDSLQGDSLSLSQAVSQALQHNHNIIIARNQAQIDQNNATIGNAGYLPRIVANSSYSQTVENTRLNFAGNTPDTSRSGSRSNQFNAGVSMQYTLFDGFGNAYRMRSLDTQAELGDAQSRLQIEGTLLQVVQRYLQVLARDKLTKINREAVTISQERYERARQQYQLGGRTKVNLLNAEVALNQDSIRYVQSQASLHQAKRELLVLLGSNPSENISVESSVEIDKELELQKLLQGALNNNASLISSQLRSKQAKLSLQQSRAGRYPQLNAEASYNYNRSESEANLLTFQETDGFTGGLSLNFTIFDGFRRNIDIQNAQIQLKNSRQERRLAEKQLRRDMRNAYEEYSTNLFLLKKQRLNVQTAELNFSRTRQAFELGQVSNTEFREAQLNLLRAQQELVNLEIDAKLSEVELRQLGGQLLESTGS